MLRIMTALGGLDTDEPACPLPAAALLFRASFHDGVFPA